MELYPETKTNLKYPDTYLEQLPPELRTILGKLHRGCNFRVNILNSSSYRTVKFLVLTWPDGHNIKLKFNLTPYHSTLPPLDRSIVYKRNEIRRFVSNALKGNTDSIKVSTGKISNIRSDPPYILIESGPFSTEIPLCLELVEALLELDSMIPVPKLYQLQPPGLCHRCSRK
jgi:hypothetical protein